MRKYLILLICVASFTGAAAESHKVAASAVAARIGDLWGIVDLSGHWKVPPAYKSAYYSRGDGFFIIKDDRGLEGLADPTGKWVLRPKFEQLLYTGPGPKRLIGAKLGDYWGYVDRAGDWVIPAKFDFVETFDASGFAVVGTGLKYGVVDSAGRWIAEPKFAFISNFNKNGIAFATLAQHGKVGLIDKSGKWVTEPTFDKGSYFDPEGWGAVQIGSKFGYVDEHGRLAFEMDLDRLPGPFESGMALASQNGRKGFIDSRGHWIVPPILEDARNPRDGLGSAKLDGKWGFINARGKWVIPPRYESVGQFYEGNRESLAYLDGKSGFVDRFGRFTDGKLGTIAPEDRAVLNAQGWARAKFGGRWGVLSSSGHWLLPARYDCVEIC